MMNFAEKKFYANLNTIAFTHCIFNLYQKDVYLCDYLEDGIILHTKEEARKVELPEWSKDFIKKSKILKDARLMRKHPIIVPIGY